MWQDEGVVLKPKKRGRDFAQNALRVVEQAIGEHIDGAPLIDTDAGKNQAALSLSKLGASDAQGYTSNGSRTIRSCLECGGASWIVG